MMICVMTSAIREHGDALKDLLPAHCFTGEKKSYDVALSDEAAVKVLRLVGLQGWSLEGIQNEITT